jgi:amino acid adenylation domain-containing protein
MQVPATTDLTIARRFRDVAAASPDALAIISPGARYTYAQLDRWSDAIAATLTPSAETRARPVAIITRDHVTLVPAALAAVKAGHFFVAIDASDPRERITAILEASNAEFCLTDDRSSAFALPTVVIAPSPSETVQPVDVEAHELVQLVFTSGTTGTPKAVATRQRFFAERLVQAAATTGRSAGERVSYTALPGFARATGEIFGSLLNGATLCAFDARTQRLDELAAMIARERISILTLTPALFRRFMRVLPDDADLSSIRKLRLGADVVTVADVDAWRARFPLGTTLERAYNSTETGAVLQMTIHHDTPIPGPLVPMGRPREGVEVRVLDEAGNEVPDGMAGELVVRSRSVAHGYWNAPAATTEAFIFDGSESATFRTGDLVRRGADGLFYFLGRRDSRLKIHGRRIDPLEIETALVTHGGAREAVVVAHQDERGESQLIAYVVLHAGATITARELRAALRERIAAWLIPARIHILDALPMTPAGKVDRAQLRQPLHDERTEPATLDGDALERLLREIWSRALSAPVSLTDDFFEDLGGDSLVAAELVSEVERATGQAMPLSLLLELNTVTRMAGYLRVSGNASRIVIPLNQRGARPPLFCVSGKGGSVIVFRQLAARLGNEQPFYGLTHHGIERESFPRDVGVMAALYVDAIRATQPAGPYFLAGYSAGGYVAYEVARQLKRAGDEVAFLGLIDVAATRRLAPLWKRYLKFFSVLRRNPRTNTPRFLRALGRRAVAITRWLLRRPAATATPPRPTLEANEAFDALHARRSLQPYSGPVTLFVARHGFGTDNALPDLGWRALCGDRLDIVEVEGEHHTVLNDEVESLAEAFRRSLEKARARPD